MSRSGTDSGLRGRTPVVLALLALAVVLVLAASDDDGRYRVSVVVPAAVNVLAGQEVTAGAGAIGSVTSVEPRDGGRAARITLEVSDERFRPLTSDTRLAVRFGGTVSSTNRHLLLVPGTSGRTVPDGGQLPAAAVHVPVEIDEVAAAFTDDVRDDLRTMLRSTARTARRSAPEVQRALRGSAPAVRGAKALLRDLTLDQASLRTLVRSSGAVLDAVNRSTPDIRALFDGGARTFGAIASEADAMDRTLRRLPGGLRQARATLADADVTLRAVGGLTDRLVPAVTEARRIAAPLNRTLHRLRAITPPARALLARGKDATDLGKALNFAADVSPELRSIGRQATDELECVRPYSPEIALLGTTWADWMSPVDERDHLLRATVQNYLPAQFNSSPLTPGDAAKLYPGLTYGFPRPPGALADQPWHLPECGAGRDAEDPSKDEEALTFQAAQQTPPGASRGRGGRP